MRAFTHVFPKHLPQSCSIAMRFSLRHVLPHSSPSRTPGRAIGLRALVLLLIVLLLLFVGLMQMTGGYHVGGPVLGSILLIGLGAANYAR